MAELGRHFTLNVALQRGMLPVIWAAHDPDALLSAYNGLYLRDEVQMEGLVRNIGSFAGISTQRVQQACETRTRV